MGQGVLRVHRSCPVSIIIPIFGTHAFVHHRCYVILAANSVIEVILKDIKEAFYRHAFKKQCFEDALRIAKRLIKTTNITQTRSK